MSSISICRRNNQLSFVAFVNLALLWVASLPVTGQQISERFAIGSSVYKKLVQTHKEYEAALATGDSLEVAEMCYRLGKRYGGVGDYMTSQKYFIRSLRIREPYGYSEAVGKTYLFMAHYQVQQKKYATAMKTVRKAMTNFNAAGSTHAIMSGNLSMAGVHALGFELRRGAAKNYPDYSLDSALYYFQRAEALALILKKATDIANIYFCKGMFLVQPNATLGLHYLRKADTIFLKENASYNVINTSLALADVHLSRQQSAEAARLLTRAQRILDTTKLGDYQQITYLWQIRARLHEQNGNWAQALEAQKHYHQFSTTALRADQEGAITRLGLEYDTQAKEVQLQWQRKFLMIVLCVSVLAIVASLVFYRFFRRYKRLSQQNAVLVREQNHRVKNNLQEVVSLLTLQSNRITNKEAQQAIGEGLLRVEAMALVHQRLYANHDRLVEIDLRGFIPELVEGVLLAYHRLDVELTYRIDPIWLHADQAIPLGLIINELVTNACKYAFLAHYEPALGVTCEQVDDTITVELRDNGPGFDWSKGNKTFGLTLIDGFVQTLGGQAKFSNNGTLFQLSFYGHSHASRPTSKANA